MVTDEFWNVFVSIQFDEISIKSSFGLQFNNISNLANTND